MEANWEPVKASGSHRRCREVVEDMWEVRMRSGRGLERRRKVQKRWEGTGR